MLADLGGWTKASCFRWTPRMANGFHWSLPLVAAALLTAFVIAGATYAVIRLRDLADDLASLYRILDNNAVVPDRPGGGWRRPHRNGDRALPASPNLTIT
jgi:hypothetical protein